MKNSAGFTKFTKAQRVEDGEKLCSYDVTALFTNVRIDKVLACIRRELEADDTLQERT